MASDLPYHTRNEPLFGPARISRRKRTILLLLVFVIFGVLWLNSDLDKVQDTSITQDWKEDLENHEDMALEEIRPVESQWKEPQHYNYFVLIASRVGNTQRRQLIRNNYFGLQDNLEPCMKRDRGVQYLFWLYGDMPQEKTAERRAYETEHMEWNDFVKVETDTFHQDKLLRWARDYFEQNKITFDYLIIQDGYSLIQLNSIQQTINSQASTDLIWFSPQSSNILVAGSNAFEKLWEYESDIIDFIPDSSLTLNLFEFSRAIDIQRKVIESQAESDRLREYFKFPVFLNDPRHVSWDNNIETISDQAVSVANVYQESDFTLLAQTLHIAPLPVCQSLQKAHVAVVTSSFIYPDSCMEQAAPLAADNKRDYAKAHDYAFIARSTEFAQQALRSDKRRTVWGKIDAVQKVLPKYDWIFWLDMDAVIMNPEHTVQGTLDQLRAEYPGGPRAFEENIDLVIAKPTRDKMINAGVFFMRNTEWSMQFLREVQAYKKWYNLAPSFEQGAMWELLQLPKHAPRVLLLENDDHTFNTLPKRYFPGDFIVHFAPDKCPGPAVLNGLEAAKRIQQGEIIERFEE
ncbi:hypothetical protein G6F56_007141 [Rhizopus delemar]|uniref:Uncharacterized protein n=1 Tax=Rhizopus stolonifer TaxID=4846 RepID=A0A367JDM4_RHIST|nr:hypothetical protein G6F56_007141 [Rhizopus delemar]RCH87969.1 hypothetical protein CU098_007644 [Rhizopus stolonifer]